MRLFLLYVCSSLTLTLPLVAQPGHSGHVLGNCAMSPTPGKRPENMTCAVLARKQFTLLPKGPIFLRLETFPRMDTAQSAVTPASTTVEAVGKIWLLTLAQKGERSKDGTLVKEIGPIPAIPPAASYELTVAEADAGPEMEKMTANAVHTHPGPEIFYLFTGEQCLETPYGATFTRAGDAMMAPANTPMQLNIIGPSKRDALFVVIHDTAKPRVVVSDWEPKGTCQKQAPKPKE